MGEFIHFSFMLKIAHNFDAVSLAFKTLKVLSEMVFKVIFHKCSHLKQVKHRSRICQRYLELCSPKLATVTSKRGHKFPKPYIISVASSFCYLFSIFTS